MNFLANLRIKTRLFITIVCVSLFMLILSLFSSSKIRETVQSQVPLQVKSLVSVEQRRLEQFLGMAKGFAKFFA
ncbi:MAG TPA: hypothetical protein PKO06_09670 [Candidatus Ozemobacteraceae bacterium]|nr:hypothetical protein [Candidatus Ozemobacteraceae bacterium]